MSATVVPIIVVIGNGMVGYKFCEKMVARAAPFQLVVFGEETRAAYDRVHLSAYFDGKTAGRPRTCHSRLVFGQSYYVGFGGSCPSD